MWWCVFIAPALHYFSYEVRQWKHLAPVPSIPCSLYTMWWCIFIGRALHYFSYEIRQWEHLAPVPSIPCSLYTITRAGLPNNEVLRW
ncbi:MAG: hypothetical protein F6K39_27430 [Okeania sp. SIO3B3]|nr:hypothetical protein [Okeania sp. SIO3B3]